MKIAIPIISFGKSGGHRVLSQLANYWIELGHEVFFVVNVTSEPIYFPTQAKILWINKYGCIATYSEEYRNSLIKGPRYYFNTLNSLRKAINSFCKECDVILANHSFVSFPVYFSTAKVPKWHYIQADESEYYNLSESGLKGYVFSSLCKLSHKLPLNKIVNSHLYINYNNIKTDKVVYPGLDLNTFYPKKTNSLNSPLIIGVIGRNEVYKGTKYVYEAYQKLKNLMPIELWVAFGELQVTGDEGIRSISPKNDAELSDFYRSVDIIVAPGTIQLGAVHYPVIEGMACGTIVITTGYYPANSKNSYIVPTHNSEKIVEAILEIKKNGCALKTAIALENIQEFSWNNVASKMLNYFNPSIID